MNEKEKTCRIELTDEYAESFNIKALGPTHVGKSTNKWILKGVAINVTPTEPCVCHIDELKGYVSGDGSVLGDMLYQWLGDQVPTAALEDKIWHMK